MHTDQISEKWLASTIRPFLRGQSDPWLNRAALECARNILFYLNEQPKPDWADVRETARNARMTPQTWTPGRVHWGRRNEHGLIEHEHGWIAVTRSAHRIMVDLTGPMNFNRGGPTRTASLLDPSPAEVLSAARLVGLDGGTP